MKKKTALLLSTFLSMFTLVGCGSSQNIKQEVKETTETKEINFVVPDGLPAIASAKLIKEKPDIKDGYNVNYTIEQSPESLITSAVKGEVDVAIVPSNAASTVYNKNKKYKIAATIGWGSLYLVSEDSITDLSELKGKEVYNTGKGLTPDIIFKEILKNNNISEDEIDFSYVGAASELAQLVATGKAKYAVVPEPV